MRFRRAIGLLDEMLATELFQTESDHVGVLRDSRALRELARNRLDRAGTVGELPHGRGGPVQAMRFLALEVVDDDLVQNRFGPDALVSCLRVRFAHVPSSERCAVESVER
jgi:hypothetical protein